MNQLNQPILWRHPEHGHDLKNVLTLTEFIKLLKEEEDYYPGEQHNTKLMITRLRKIFYDKWGWNRELVEGAAHIDTRYQVTVVDDATEHTQEISQYTHFAYDPKHRSVTYTDHDRVYGNTRAGKPTFIYSYDHQEVVLPDGTYCDIAHILAGLDAHNYPQVVTPLPQFLRFMKLLFPHVNSNMDVATWIGDIGSSAGGFLFAYLFHKKKPLTIKQEQGIINVEVPGSDMLGDIEPYVIKEFYDVSSNNGKRFTEILEDYYLTDNPYRKHRCSIFCKANGLKGWDGNAFQNEAEWLQFYKKQLRDDTTFQVFSLTNEKLNSIWLPIVIWFNGFRDVLKLELLLKLFLERLKEEIKREPQV